MNDHNFIDKADVFVAENSQSLLDFFLPHNIFLRRKNDFRSSSRWCRASVDATRGGLGQVGGSPAGDLMIDLMIFHDNP